MAISKKNAKNLPESPKNLDDFNTFFLNFFEIFQKAPLTSSSGLFFWGAKWRICATKKITDLPLPKILDNRENSTPPKK
jgi:hypothetical protein